MGRKAKWFGAVKKVFSPDSKKSHKSKENPGVGKIQKSVSGIGKIQNWDTSTSESFEAEPPTQVAVPDLAATIVPRCEEIKIVETNNGRSKQAPTVAGASVATPEEVAVSKISRFPGKSREEEAAIKIQTAFRGYLARKALRALRGLVRLKSLIHGSSAKHQATTTLRCMQTLARVQSQIRSRRIRMSEDNQALQRQLLLKRERELENLRMGEEWDDSFQSKQQIESSLLSKQEAAVRRERALAYAFSHQWKNSSNSANPLFMDPNNPHWGWSWMERWMAARPWESKNTSDKNLSDDHASVKSTSQTVGGEITNSYSRRDINSDKPSPMVQKPNLPASHRSHLTPISKSLSVMGKVAKSASPRKRMATPDDDSRSVISMQSELPRRHSMGSVVRDDESVTSLASSPAVPSYMAQTQSARARSRFQTLADKTETTTDNGSVASVKKRLSFPVGEKHNVPPQTEARRHSGPPKVEITSVKDGNMVINTEQTLSNGGSM